MSTIEKNNNQKGTKDSELFFIDIIYQKLMKFFCKKINNYREKTNGKDGWILRFIVRFFIWLFCVTSIMFIFNGWFNGYYYTGGFFKAFDRFPSSQSWLFLISINVLLWMIYNKICQLTELLRHTQTEQQIIKDDNHKE